MFLIYIYKINEEITCTVEKHDDEGIFSEEEIFNCPIYLTHESKFTKIELFELCGTIIKNVVKKLDDNDFKVIKEKLISELIEDHHFSKLEYESVFTYEYNLEF